MLKPRTALLAVVADGSLSDADLVARFVAHRDEAAFAALVRRHGPTVFGVCRKTLRHTADAEDAFQATFLVLVRKAGRVAFRRDIASWLVAVAVRASREVLRQRARRESRETSEPFDAAAPEASTSGEACAVLLREVAKLPAAYRAAVTLCELAGVSRADAAKRLGIPEGTLSSRLAAARRKLAVRLTARGLAATLPVLVLPVPPALAARVLDLASTSAVPSATVTHLAEATMRTTIPLRTLATAAAVLLAVVGLGFGDEPAKPPEAKPAAAKAEGKEPSRIYFTRDGRLYALAPDGKDERRIVLAPLVNNGSAQLSPDRKSWAMWEDGPDNGGSLLIAPGQSSGKPIADRVSLPRNLGYRRFCWSPDGTQVHVSQSSWDKPGAVEHYAVDAKTRKVTRLKVLPDHIVVAVTPDGKAFLTVKVGSENPWRPKSIHLMYADGTELRKLAETEGWCAALALSPDGTRALCTIDKKLAVVDATKFQPPAFVEGVPDDKELTQAAWSPDGKRIAYTTGTWQFLKADEQRELESRLVVCDPSGRNATVLRAVKGESFGPVFWR